MNSRTADRKKPLVDPEAFTSGLGGDPNNIASWTFQGQAYEFLRLVPP